MRRTWIIIPLIVGAAACATTSQTDLQVRIDHDDATDFSAWKTYRFATFPPEDASGTRVRGLENQVRHAIEENLSARGYERIEDGVPDFRIAHELVTRGDHGSDVNRRYANDPISPTQASPSTTNTLIVRMLHPSTAEVLWEGRVAGFSIDAIQHQAEIENAVWRLFVEFPPIVN
jgi:hypothetical protein